MAGGQTPPSAGSDGRVPLLNGDRMVHASAINRRTTSSDDIYAREDGPLMLPVYYRPDVEETFIQVRNIRICPI